MVLLVKRVVDVSSISWIQQGGGGGCLKIFASLIFQLAAR
jgi:hypothetical protein